jgi:hypothetical protein
MASLDSYKSKAPAIVGSTTINHAARVSLGLNCSEYAFLDHMARKQDKGEVADTLSTYIQTGFSPDNQQQILKGLILKGFIIIKGDECIVTSKWMDGFADIEKEFDEFFWKEDGKVAWPGVRKKALEYYIKVRRKYSRDFLSDQRRYYFEYLILEHKNGFARQKLMAQVFLNPENERYLEDWQKYRNDLKEKLGMNRPAENAVKPVTREEVNKAYAKEASK